MNAYKWLSERNEIMEIEENWNRSESTTHASYHSWLLSFENANQKEKGKEKEGEANLFLFSVNIIS